MEEEKPLTAVHVKLLAFDLLSLTRTPPTFSRGGLSISRAETLGTVTSLDHKPGCFLKFTVDDGTGCVPCILWLNLLTAPQLASRRAANPDGVMMAAEAAASQSALVRIGAVARVWGRITSYRGTGQITVARLAIERDPNAEILHWLDCLRLARSVYDRRSDSLRR
ncbi:hypothetical protein SAY86_023809 [Trapa natans]|uniref:CST complex subunit STN1 n=1 Tax=Trapa natans TaxID=22666 RepID=A0AAN7LWE5_TRANT|nr:hypothetical protein SAY86_023809 [Trapa natans]